MDQFRVVQLRNSISNQIASGYLVRKDLILTSHHLFHAPDNTTCNVRFLEDVDKSKRVGWNENGCELVWFSTEQDIALLKLTCDLPIWVTNKVQDLSVPRFGKFKTQEIAGKNMGIGFVNYKDNSGINCSKELPLFGTMRRSIQVDEIELHLDQSLTPSTPTDWQGISGTAFFANGYLVGVTKKTDEFLGEKVLCAIPISRVYENTDFCQHVFAGEDKPLLSCVTEEL